VEKGEMTPTDSLVHKLEKALNITLKEVMEDTGEIKKADNSRGLTLGDFIKVKEKKN
jgi:ribosome-binding protein aMBF1 (putative translation factor)